MRIGQSIDIHQLKQGRPLILGGVSIEHEKGLDGHSDADVLTHAMIKERLDSGELGDIIHCYVRRNSPIIGPRRYIGASDLSMHVMIHDIDYLNW